MDKSLRKLEQNLASIKLKLEQLLASTPTSNPETPARALSAPDTQDPTAESINPRLITLLENLMDRLAELKEAVQRNSDVIDSAIQLLRGVSSRLLDVKYDPEAIHALAVELNDDAQALAAAITAATPVAIPQEPLPIPVAVEPTPTPVDTSSIPGESSPASTESASTEPASPPVDTSSSIDESNSQPQ